MEEISTTIFAQEYMAYAGIILIGVLLGLILSWIIKQFKSGKIKLDKSNIMGFGLDPSGLYNNDNETSQPGSMDATIKLILSIYEEYVNITKETEKNSYKRLETTKYQKISEASEAILNKYNKHYIDVDHDYTEIFQLYIKNEITEMVDNLFELLDNESITEINEVDLELRIAEWTKNLLIKIQNNIIGFKFIEQKVASACVEQDNLIKNTIERLVKDYRKLEVDKKLRFETAIKNRDESVNNLIKTNKVKEEC